MRLGRQGVFVPDAVNGDYVGVDYGMVDDIKGDFTIKLAAFNQAYIPRYLELNPGKTELAAGLAGGTLWKTGKGLEDGDYIVTPRSTGTMHVGRVAAHYEFVHAS